MKNDFLSQILEAKQQQIQTAQTTAPLKNIRELAENRDAASSRFENSLCNKYDAINIIAEIKRASPSKGDICPNLDAASLAKEYYKGGAAAISVLTEPQFFKGSIADLEAVKEAVDLPILRKDFIISEYQIYESAAIGADAILLIVRCLEKQQLKDYMQLAKSLHLDCLVEVYDAKDVKTAIEVNAKVVGINNRNLQNFDTSITHAAVIAAMLKEFQVPVAASGIEKSEDIEFNKAYGIKNFLVGESIVRSGEPEIFIKRLRGVIR